MYFASFPCTLRRIFEEAELELPKCLQAVTQPKPASALTTPHQSHARGRAGDNSSDKKRRRRRRSRHSDFDFFGHDVTPQKQPAAANTNTGTTSPKVERVHANVRPLPNAHCIFEAHYLSFPRSPCTLHIAGQAFDSPTVDGVVEATPPVPGSFASPFRDPASELRKVKYAKIAGIIQLS